MTSARAEFCKHRILVTNTQSLTKVEFESINVLQRKMLQSMCVGFELMAKIGLRQCDEWITESVWLGNLSLFRHWRNNLPNVNVRLLPRLQPSNLEYQGLDIGLRQISGNSIFDIKPSRKRGRPFIKWDDKLSNIAWTIFPTITGGLPRGWNAIVARCWAVFRFAFCDILWTFYF